MAVAGQFAPPAGQEGTTAIVSDSSLISGWAGAPEIIRGAMDIAQPENGEVTFGNPADASGVADNAVVSLGDGGKATFSLETVLSDHPGPEFAVFENSFSDEFLELAFVEVSSDGETFVRFPAVSLTQTETQVGGFSTLDANKIHNLAGKYRAGFGTPFDLQDLSDSTNVDISAITHIRIIDVIGSIAEAYATHDSEGNKVNDPYPTAFESGGFDLDAVAFLEESTLSQEEVFAKKVALYPNPVKDRITIEVNEHASYLLRNSSGQILEKGMLVKGSQSFSWGHFTNGVYILQISGKEKSILKKIIIH
jgi:hypothetical protein